MNKPLLAACLLLASSSQAALVSGRAVTRPTAVAGAFKPVPVNILAAPSFTLTGGPLLTPSLTPMIAPQVEPLSGFLETIAPDRFFVALKPAKEGLETHKTIYYQEPSPEKRRMTGPSSYYLDPVDGEMRPGSDLRKDVKRLKKVLATLPEQIESVWPTWRESLIAGVGMGSDNTVYVDLVSRDPVTEHYYATARLVKRGKRWTVADGDKKPSAIDLLTRPTAEGDRHMHPAKHSLRDSDVVQDARAFPSVLNRLLSALPKKYASYVIDVISLGLRPQADSEGSVWARARLSSNKPVTRYEYETVNVVKP